jgi:hypothetical protein
MMAVLFTERAGIQLLHVPYKSSPETVKAVLGGEVSIGICDVTSSLPLVQSGRARALAVGTERRLPGAPAISTTAEAGLDDYTVAPWNGIMAPTGVPKPIVDKLADVFVRIMAMPETREFFDKQNVEMMAAGQEPMRKFQREEVERWKRIREVAKIEQQ